MRQRHIGGIAALGDQDTADPRRIVARIEGVPLAAEIDLDPGREIHRRVGRRKADVADIAGAVAAGMFRQRQNVAARWAKSRQTPRRSAKASAAVRVGARMLVAEGDVLVHEVADRLHPRPAERRLAEEAPGLVGQAVGLAVAAAEQEQQGFRRQVLNLVLAGRPARPGSGKPRSRTTVSVLRLKRPAGATSRLHQLPKLSR